MGWNPFKDDPIVSVATSVQRVIADKDIPNSLKLGATKGILAGSQLTEYIMEEMMNNLGTKVESGYTYAKTNYINGLPSGHILEKNSVQDAVTALISSMENKTITLHYAKYGEINRMHYGYTYLRDTYQYNQATNELPVLSTQKGTPVYLTNLQAVLTQANYDNAGPSALEEWQSPAKAGYSPLYPLASQLFYAQPKPSNYVVDAAATADYFVFDIAYTETTYTKVNDVDIPHIENKTERIYFPMIPIVSNESYYQVKYSYGSATNNPIKKNSYSSDYLDYQYYYDDPQYTIYNPPKDEHVIYVTYKEGTGTFPELDMLFKPPSTTTGTFFPFSYFRYDATPVSAQVWPQQHTAQKALMKKYGLDFDLISTKVNENPGIEDVRSAIMMFAASTESTDQNELKYLFDFFKQTYTETGGGLKNRSSILDHINKDLASPNQLFMFIHSMKAQTEYSIVIQDLMYKVTLTFSGIYRKIKKGIITPAGTIGKYASEKRMDNTTVLVEFPTDDPNVVNYQERTFTIPSFIFKHQVSASMYEEITVYELQTTYWIDGEYTAAASPILIPLDHSITKHYKSSVRESLYARSMYFVFNSKKVQVVKWYQSTFFDFIMKVIQVVLLVYGYCDTSSLTGSLAASMSGATAGAMYFAAYVAINVVSSILFSAVFKIFVKAAGVNASTQIAIALTLIALKDFIGNDFALTARASDLLMLASGLTSGVTSVYKDLLLDLSKEYSVFNSEQEEKSRVLTERSELLEWDKTLATFIVDGESPDRLYNRTIHSGNIGVYGIESVHSYVDTALTLPKLSQTIGV